MSSGAGDGDSWKLTLIEDLGVRDVMILAGSCVLGTWLVELARETSAISDGRIELAFCDGDDVPPDLGRQAGAPRILVVAGPNRRVTEALTERQVPVIGLIDDPVDAVRFLVQKRGCSQLEALRTQTKYFCAHEFLLGHPNATLVRRGSPDLARSVVGRVLTIVDDRLESDARDGLIGTFAGSEEDAWSLEDALRAKVDGYMELKGAATAVSADDAATIRGVLSPLLLGALTRDVTFVWPHSVFLSGDNMGSVSKIIDVTGGSRIVFFGPYFHLASGDWNARMLVGFFEEAKSTTFRMRLLCEHEPLAEMVLKPTGSGVFHGHFALRHSAPERWLELQFTTTEGMIDGRITLGYIEFHRRL